MASKKRQTAPHCVVADLGHEQLCEPSVLLAVHLQPFIQLLRQLGDPLAHAREVGQGVAPRERLGAAVALGQHAVFHRVVVQAPGDAVQPQTGNGATVS